MRFGYVIDGGCKKCPLARLAGNCYALRKKNPYQRANDANRHKDYKSFVAAAKQMVRVLETVLAKALEAKP
jgi:hypothetical protein